MISRNQQNKIETDEIIPKKMPVFNCICEVKILIIPDIPEMNKAIKNHIIEHKKITGKTITEEILTQEILTTILKSINGT